MAHPRTIPSQESRASLYSGAQTNAKLVLMKVTCRALQCAPSTDGKARAPSPVLSSKQDDNPHRLCVQLWRCLWKDCSQMS
jgi:hypothetical protein